VVVGDARTAIADLPDGAYDVVVGDAFGSRAVPWHLATVEMAEQVRRVLRPGGAYALNLIDAPPLSLARAETATLLAVFDDVVVLAPPPLLAGEDSGNLVLVASDDPVDRAALGQRAAVRGEPGSVADRRRVQRFAEGAQVLTDDDAPVDQLLSP
jgi:spermidine synthase